MVKCIGLVDIWNKELSTVTYGDIKRKYMLGTREILNE